MTHTLLAVLALTALLIACAAPPRASLHGPSLLERSATVNNQAHKFAIGVPAAYDPRTPCPCVLFLHGAGECGTDALKQTTVGLLSAAKADPAQWPCIIVMPQKPTPQREWEDYDDMVMACLRAAERELAIDQRRVSLTGLSQGGHGAWVLGARHRDVFSHLAPICGYVHTRRGGVTLDPSDASTLAPFKGKPIWAFHGEKDDVVPPSESKDMIAALRALHITPEPRLTLYPDANHNSWDNAYRKENLGAWLTR